MFKILKSAVTVTLPAFVLGIVTVLVIQGMALISGFSIDPKEVFMAGVWAVILTLIVTFSGYVAGSFDVE